jgi:SRSO17 transposase
MMDATVRFDRDLEHLAEGLGHSDRRSGLRGSCMGLMLPLARKSLEPMAARAHTLSQEHLALAITHSALAGAQLD